MSLNQLWHTTRIQIISHTIKALSVLALLQGIANANYLVTVRDSYFDLGNSHIALISDSGVVLNPNFVDPSFLSGPTAMAIGPNGNLYVTNALTVAQSQSGPVPTPNGNKIQEFDIHTGAYIGTFADASDGLNGPSAMKFFNGNFYVANLGDPASALAGIATADTVQKFDATTGAPSTFVSGLAAPSGLLIDNGGNVYVSEAVGYNVNTVEDPVFEYHVSQFNSSGALIAGPFTNPDGSVIWPAGMTVDSATGDILIASVVGHSVTSYNGSSISQYIDLSSMQAYPTGTIFTGPDTFWVYDSAYAGIFEYAIDRNSGVASLVVPNDFPANLNHPLPTLLWYSDFGVQFADFGISIGDILAVPVPEPTGAALAWFGIACFGFWRRRAARH